MIHLFLGRCRSADVGVPGVRVPTGYPSTIGGNIPGQTRVLSIEIYNHVEAMEYAQAHWLAGGMMLVSFIGLLLIYCINYQSRRKQTATYQGKRKQAATYTPSTRQSA